MSVLCQCYAVPCQGWNQHYTTFPKTLHGHYHTQHPQTLLHTHLQGSMISEELTTAPSLSWASVHYTSPVKKRFQSENQDLLVHRPLDGKSINLDNSRLVLWKGAHLIIWMLYWALPVGVWSLSLGQGDWREISNSQTGQPEIYAEFVQNVCTLATGSGWNESVLKAAYH